jgi:hypothetical protein
VVHKPSFVRHLSVSPVPNLRKTLQLPQSDLTPWKLTLGSLQDILEDDDLQLEWNFRNSLVHDLVKVLTYVR